MKNKKYYEILMNGIIENYNLGFSENMKLGVARHQFNKKSSKEFPMNVRSKVATGESDKYEWIRINNLDELWIYYNVIFQSWIAYICPEIISTEERLSIYKVFRERYLQWDIDSVLDDILDLGIDEFLEEEKEKKEKRSEVARKNKNKHMKLMKRYENPHITKERKEVEKTIERLKKEGKWYIKKK